MAAYYLLMENKDGKQTKLKPEELSKLKRQTKCWQNNKERFAQATRAGIYGTLTGSGLVS